MDLVQNSVEANASEVELTIRETAKQIAFSVKDNGKGMSKEVQAKAIDPFYSDGEKHAHRRVGLGLPFLIQTAEAANGHADIQSEEGCGTQINFAAEADHIDLPPFGDFAAAATMMLSQSDGFELRITRETETDRYSLSRTELQETLGDLNDTQNLMLMKTYIYSQEEDLRKAG
jgi:signal transduction histidine kinase